MRGRIAMISEHASPLARLGSVDAGGQNVYVASTARELASLGCADDVFTRRDDATLPAVVDWYPDVRIVHVDAGRRVRAQGGPPALDGRLRRAHRRRRASRRRAPRRRHAHTRALLHVGACCAQVKDELALPYVVTFQPVGRVRLMHHGVDDFPPERGALKEMVMEDADAIVAEYPQDASDLCAHYACKPRRITIIPCGFDPNEFAPVDRVSVRAPGARREPAGDPAAGPHGRAQGRRQRDPRDAPASQLARHR